MNKSNELNEVKEILEGVVDACSNGESFVCEAEVQIRKHFRKEFELDMKLCDIINRLIYESINGDEAIAEIKKHFDKIFEGKYEVRVLSVDEIFDVLEKEDNRAYKEKQEYANNRDRAKAIHDAQEKRFDEKET